MEAITLNVQLTLEQFIKAIEDLPREERGNSWKLWRITFLASK